MHFQFPDILHLRSGPQSLIVAQDKSLLLPGNYTLSFWPEVPLSSATQQLSRFLSIKPLALRYLQVPFGSTFPINAQNTIVLVAVLFCFYVLRSTFRCTTRSKAFKRPHGRALSSLAKVIIPTCSVWPQLYLDLTRESDEKRLVDSDYDCVHIPLDTLLRDILQGRIELRDPVADLHQLIYGRLIINDWLIRLSLSNHDRFRAVLWYLRSEFSCCFKNESLKPIAPGNKSTFAVDGSHRLMIYEKVIANTSPGHSSDSLIWPSLESIPRSYIASLLTNALTSLRSSYPRGTKSFFTFSTAKLPMTPFDTPFVLAALVFSHLTSNSCSPSNPNHYGRSPLTSLSPSPFFIRLSDVLSVFARQNVHVRSTTDVSDAYAYELDAYASTLERDPDAVKKMLRTKGMGVRGWREARLCARWEAALYRAGVLVKWVVCVEVGGEE